MGMFPFKSSLGRTLPPNPDPKQFSVEKIKRFRPYTVLEVTYTGCTTFDGRKVLVYQDLPEINRIIDLDPHFQESGVSPVARFPATKEGWKDAVEYAKRKATSY